ncbi:MAG: DUF4276 family protein [Saprospiraceae bacterium]|nr:DUF4276 family protein [Saprospiraceae bacterium]
MVTVKIYIEGGSAQDKSIYSLFREAWSKFFESAGLKGRMPKAIPSFGRHDTYRDFCLAFNNARPNERILLLIDSEKPLVKNESIWKQLSKESMPPPEGAGEEHIFLMIQVMETWFLADIDALNLYFRPDFKATKIPKWNDLESVPKESVFKALEDATASCPKKQYAKGKISFELLKAVSTKKVTEKCPSAARLIEHLKQIS